MFGKKSQTSVFVFGILDFGTGTKPKILMIQNDEKREKEGIKWEFPGGKMDEVDFSPRFALRKKLKNLINADVGLWDIKKRIHRADYGNRVAKFYVVIVKSRAIFGGFTIYLKEESELKRTALFSIEEIIDLVNRNEMPPSHCLAFARYRDDYCA